MREREIEKVFKLLRLSEDAQRAQFKSPLEPVAPDQVFAATFLSADAKSSTLKEPHAQLERDPQ